MAIANRTGGQLRLSMLGKNLTTKEVDVYQISINTGDPLTFSFDPMSSGNYDMITVKGRDGSIIGQVQGDEQDPTGEISFSFYEDFSHLKTKYVYGNSKNLLLNLLNGETFYNNTDPIVPIGTNGTDKTLTARAKANEMNKPYKFIYYNEGAFIKENGTADPNKDGKVSMKRNPYEASFNMFNKTFCMEIMTTTGEGQVNRMLPILAKTTAEWAEGDINQFNCTANRGCDIFERPEFFTEVYSEVENMEITNELYVKQIVVAGGVEPVSGTEGDLMLVITADGTPTIKKYTSSSWSVDATLTALITIGTRFKTRKVIDTATKESNIFAVTGSDMKCVDFTTDDSKRFYCLVKDFDLKISGEFVDYITVE